MSALWRRRAYCEVLGRDLDQSFLRCPDPVENGGTFDLMSHRILLW